MKRLRSSANMVEAGSPGRLHGLRARLAREEGISLVLALVFVVAFTITTTAVINEVTSNQSSAHRDEQTHGAFALAEAAVSAGIDWVNTNDREGQLDPGETETGHVDIADTPGGDWTATKDSTVQWTVTGTADLNGRHKEVEVLLVTNEVVLPTLVVETIEGTTTVMNETTTYTETTSSTTYTTQNLSAWTGGYSNIPPGTCMSISNNAVLKQPIYSAGDLCISNNGSLVNNTGYKYSVYAGGKITLGLNSFIGTLSSKLAKATAVGGCYYGGSLKTCSDSSNSHVFADAYDSAAISIPKPTLDAASWYTNASPGPNHGCTTGTFRGLSGTAGFDGNTTRDTSIGNFNPFTGASYDCVTSSGEIKWTSGSNTFYINGTVFVDGNLNVSNNINVSYTGRGTLIVNGTITLSNNAFVCASPNTTCFSGTGNAPAWNPDSNLLVLVAANASNAATGANFGNNTWCQCAVWTNKALLISNNAGVQGPWVADGVTVSNNGGGFQPLGNAGLPSGAPAGSSTSTTYYTVTNYYTVTSSDQQVFTLTVGSTVPGVSAWVSYRWRELR